MNKIEKPVYNQPYIIPVRKLSRQMYNMKYHETMNHRIWIALLVAALLVLFW